MLILHIGLPKTASTFLQKEVFGKAENLLALHKTLPPLGRFRRLAAAFMTTLRNLIYSNNRAARRVSQLVILLAAKNRNLLITNENLSIAPRGIWRDSQNTPAKFAIWLSELNELSSEPVKVIMGIRKWDEWFASSYSQCARGFKVPGQEDLEIRVRQILEPDRSQNRVTGWLNYQESAATIANIVGLENLFIYQTEDLEKNPAQFSVKLFSFLGIEIPEAMTNDSYWAKIPARNVRRTAPNIWKLKGRDIVVTVSPAMKSHIESKFGNYPGLISR